MPGLAPHRLQIVRNTGLEFERGHQGGPLVRAPLALLVLAPSCKESWFIVLPVI